MGIGHHLRSECEPWLVLTKGSPHPVHGSVLNSERPRPAQDREADRLVLPIVEGYCRRGASPWTGPAPSWKRLRAWGLWAVGAEPDPEVYAATVARVRRAVQSPIPLRPPPVIIPTTCWICSARRRRISGDLAEVPGQLLADTLERAIDAERRWRRRAGNSRRRGRSAWGVAEDDERGQRDPSSVQSPRHPLWSEPFRRRRGGSSGHRRAPVRAPVSWMGGKRRLAPVILQRLGLAPGCGARRVLLNDAGPWGWVWPAIPRPGDERCGVLWSCGAGLTGISESCGLSCAMRGPGWTPPRRSRSGSCCRLGRPTGRRCSGLTLAEMWIC